MMNRGIDLLSSYKQNREEMARSISILHSGRSLLSRLGAMD